MISQFRTLHKLKARRENTALLAVQAKRAELAEAMAIRTAREAALAESTATLADRETAIFDDIMQKIVGTDRVELVKDKVLMLHKQHQQLADDLELAIQNCVDLERELEDAQDLYQIAQRTREKFDIVLDELIREQAVLGELVEEAEIEDAFAKRRPQHA